MANRVGRALHRCYLLHHRPFSNTSMQVEIFSKSHGRLAAIAKGVRSRHSRIRSLLQPFGEFQALFSGGGEVLTLTHIEAVGRPALLSGQSLYCGFYLNELLMRLLQRFDPHEALFMDYQQALGCLEPGGDLEPCLRRFELRLLKRLGYGVCLEFEAVTGEAVRPDAWYLFKIETGPILQQAQGQHNETIQGRTLLALAYDDIRDPVSRREARRLMRGILSHYLGDKPLKSRELFRGH